VLEDAGYLEVRKGAVGRRPRTWFRLTAAGRQAVEGHLAWLAQLEEAVSIRVPASANSGVNGCRIWLAPFVVTVRVSRRGNLHKEET
jgi:hypothetical protein